MEWVLDISVFNFSFFGKLVFNSSLFNCVGFSDVGLSGVGFSNIGLSAVWELEKAGYITRRQGRDEKGKMTAIEYTIYEQPQPPALDCPVLENPTAVRIASILSRLIRDSPARV